MFNFRSEGRQFDKSNRCLIPTSAFFEFTGKRHPKAKHRFALKGSPITAIAGIWREGKGDQQPAFTMLVVVLRPEDWAAWIYLTKAGIRDIAPSSNGRAGCRNRSAGK